MPELIINLSSIYNNAKVIKQLCSDNNITLCSVVKGCNALPEILDTLYEAKIDFWGSSRLDQIITIKNKHFRKPIWMLRTPPISLATELVNYSDAALVSEVDTLIALNDAASYANKKYGIILMADVGDLREGWWPKESMYAVGSTIKKLKNLDILGVGMNVSCYGSVMPTELNTTELIEISNKMSEILDKDFKIISGGNTTTLRLLNNSSLPDKINNLRIGEAILLGRDLGQLWNSPIKNTVTDTFVLRAEIVEIKNKPSYPIGELYVDAFAQKPSFVDRGIRKRALLYVGKADFFDPHLLVPVEEGLTILGASSDHLIIDIEDYKGNLRVGSFLEFQMFYGAMLGLTNSSDVSISFQK